MEFWDKNVHNFDCLSIYWHIICQDDKINYKSTAVYGKLLYHIFSLELIPFSGFCYFDT